MADTHDHSSAWFAEQKQALFDFFKNFAFNQLMGFELLEIEPGKARLSAQWRADLCQPAGIMHGGVMASLVDTAIAHAILLTGPSIESRSSGGRMVSLDLRLKYLRPVSEGTIFCDAKVTRLGRQIIHADAVVLNAEGKEVATGDSIYMIVSHERLQRKAD